MSNAKTNRAKPSTAVAELAKLTGWTASAIEEAIDEVIRNDGPSAKFQAFMSAAIPAGAASPSPLMRRSLEAHRLAILRETGATSVSIVVTY